MPNEIIINSRNRIIRKDNMKDKQIIFVNLQKMHSLIPLLSIIILASSEIVD